MMRQMAILLVAALGGCASRAPGPTPEDMRALITQARDAYIACVDDRVIPYCLSEASPTEAAIAAHSNCSQEFSNYGLAVRATFQKYNGSPYEAEAYVAALKQQKQESTIARIVQFRASPMSPPLCI